MGNQLWEDTFDYAFNEDGSNPINSDKELEVIVGKVVKSISPNIEESIENIPAAYGAKYLGTNYGEKQIDIPITVMCEDVTEYNRKIHNLSSILVHERRDKDIQYPIKFNSEPDVTYYGHFTSIPAPSFISEQSYDFTVTLTFMLADPRAFLPQKRIKITNNNQDILPEGNTETKPVIHIVPHRDLYYFGYESDNHYVAVGYHVNDGNQLIDSNGNTVDMNAHLVQQVNDSCNTLATWSVADSDTQNVNLYRGERDGKVTSTATAITVGKNSKGELDFGTRGKHSFQENGRTQQKWYGPVVVHNGLPKATPYWKMAVRLHHVKKDKRQKSVGNRAMGRVEVYLLDSNGDVRGRMGIQDASQGRMPVAYIQLGSSFSATNDRGHYKTIAWTQGKERHPSSTRHKVEVSYQKKEAVKVVKKKGKKLTAAQKKKLKKRGVDPKTVGKTEYKTVKKPVGKKQVNYSYNETDSFSDFYGEFSLERQKAANGMDKWIGRIVRLDPNTGMPTTGKSALDLPFNIIDPNFGFSLYNIAAFFGKVDINEDLLNPPHIYRNDQLTLTQYNEWRTDGNQDPDSTPHVIASAGQEIVIDTQTESVFVDGKNINKYVSWGSDFPSIIGGITQSLHFNPTPQDADIYVDYRPTIK